MFSAARGFTLFTALVAFLLIVLAGLLVQSMIHSESVTSDILSDVEEQVEMQAIADLARADGLQVFNYGIRYSIEEYYQDRDNYFLVDIGDLDGRPSDPGSWNEIVARFAATEFGACSPRCTDDEQCGGGNCYDEDNDGYGFCTCTADYTSGDAPQCFSGERCCKKVPANPAPGEPFTWECGDVGNGGQCHCTGEQLSYRAAQHLLDILDIGRTTFGSYGLEVDCGKNDDGTSRQCTQDLLQGTVQELISKSSAKTTGGRSDFFRIVQCDSQECEVGTFFMTLDLRAEDNQGNVWLSDAVYETLPQITITNYATGRTIREPILPRGTFRIYVPLRVFRAVYESLGAADSLQSKHSQIDEIYEGYCGDYGAAKCPSCSSNSPDSQASLTGEARNRAESIAESAVNPGSALSNGDFEGFIEEVLPATSAVKNEGSFDEYDEASSPDEAECCDYEGSHDMYCAQVRSVDIKAEFTESNTDYTVTGRDITYNVRISDSYDVANKDDIGEYYCTCSSDGHCRGSGDHASGSRHNPDRCGG